MDAALALDGLDADGADLVGEFGAEVGDVVEADEVDAGHDGHEGLAVLFFVRGGDRAHGAAVEAVVEGEEAWCRSCGLRARSRPAWARASLSAASQASVPLLQKKTRSRPLISVRRRASSAVCSWKKRFEVWIRRFALTRDGLFDRGMGVAEGGDADAAEQVEVVVAVLVAQMDALAADEEDGVALVGVEEQLLLRCLDRLRLSFMRP